MKDNQLRITFAANIRTRRAFFGISQKEFAERAGIALGSVSAYENGLKVPPADMAARIAKALNTTLDEMFSPLKVTCPCCGQGLDIEQFFNKHKSQQEATEV